MEYIEFRNYSNNEKQLEMCVISFILATCFKNLHQNTKTNVNLDFLETLEMAFHGNFDDWNLPTDLSGVFPLSVNVFKTMLTFFLGGQDSDQHLSVNPLSK